ncbi:MAG: PAS domain-containing protein [Candidatus Synoicihabitans palmerolidicus]|nr:PAS domain-containing protein [Candidatus Synoicihabitans palmerolidicus]
MVELLRETQVLAAIGGWELLLPENRLEWTDETYRIHGVEIGEPLDTERAFEFYHPEDQRKIRRVVDEAITTGKPWNLDLRIMTTAGKECRVRSTGKAELENGQATRLAGTFQDIDAAKRAQLALEASEQRFRTLAEVLPVGIFEADVSRRSIFNNTRWLEIAGITYEEALYDGWSSGIHPADRDRIFAE